MVRAGGAGSLLLRERELAGNASSPVGKLRSLLMLLIQDWLEAPPPNLHPTTLQHKEGATVDAPRRAVSVRDHRHAPNPCPPRPAAAPPPPASVAGAGPPPARRPLTPTSLHARADTRGGGDRSGDGMADERRCGVLGSADRSARPVEAERGYSIPQPSSQRVASVTSSSASGRSFEDVPLTPSTDEVMGQGLPAPPTILHASPLAVSEPAPAVPAAETSAAVADAKEARSAEPRNGDKHEAVSRRASTETAASSNDVVSSIETASDSATSSSSDVVAGGAAGGAAAAAAASGGAEEAVAAAAVKAKGEGNSLALMPRGGDQRAVVVPLSECPTLKRSRSPSAENGGGPPNARACCALCGHSIGGHTFMLHDRPYCSAECRLQACRDSAKEGASASASAASSPRVSAASGVTLPPGAADQTSLPQSQSAVSLASSNSSTGLYASFRPWL